MPKTVFSDEYRIFRELMRELRIQKGMTQAELSSALGMAQSFVSKYEMGERRLDFVEVDKICEVLGFDLPNFVAAYYSRLHVSNKQAIKHGKRIRKS